MWPSLGPWPYSKPEVLQNSRSLMGPLQMLQTSGSLMFIFRVKTLSGRDSHWRNPRKKIIESAAIWKVLMSVHWLAQCHKERQQVSASNWNQTRRQSKVSTAKSMAELLGQHSCTAWAVWTSEIKRRAYLVCASRYGQRPARLKKECYHSRDTDSYQESKGFNALSI